MVFRDAKGTRRVVFERSKPHEKLCCLYLAKKTPVIDPFMVMAYFSEDLIKELKLPNQPHFKREDIQNLHNLLQEYLAKSTSKVLGTQPGEDQANSQAFDEAAEEGIEEQLEENQENKQQEPTLTATDIKTITVEDPNGFGDTTDTELDSSDSSDDDDDDDSSTSEDYDDTSTSEDDDDDTSTSDSSTSG